MKPQTTHNNLREEQVKQYKQGSRPTSKSEEEEGTQINIKNEWQVIRNCTRKEITKHITTSLKIN
jgi:hypothetical protein